MKKSQLKRIIKEEILKEIKTSPHSYESDEHRAYALADAELSNAVLELDPDIATTMNRAQVAYKELGPKLDDYLRERFENDSIDEDGVEPGTDIGVKNPEELAAFYRKTKDIPWKS